MEIKLRKKYRVYNGDRQVGTAMVPANQYGNGRRGDGAGRRGLAKVTRPPDRVEQLPAKTMQVNGLTGRKVMVRS